jgi:hypothetical protein
MAPKSLIKQLSLSKIDSEKLHGLVIDLDEQKQESISGGLEGNPDKNVILGQVINATTNQKIRIRLESYDHR